MTATNTYVEVLESGVLSPNWRKKHCTCISKKKEEEDVDGPTDDHTK